MPSYSFWTVTVNCKSELVLKIDEQLVTDYFSKNVQRQPAVYGLSSSKITSIVMLPDRVGHIQISMGKLSLKLQAAKFKSTELFGKMIENITQLVELWDSIGDFVQTDEYVNGSDSEGDESLELYETDNSQGSLFSSTGYSKDTDDSMDPTETASVAYEPERREELPEEETESDNENQETVNRENLITSISQKMVTFKVLDIFTLLPPPPKYRVRDVNKSFVKALTDKMIEKNSVSVDNAPTVIGFIDIDKSAFETDKISTYSIHIIDGNHSIKAQKAAYRKTGSRTFKFRGVNIYCGLTEDEALFLGISRNEDTGSFVRFNDFQKVDLIRRKLYSMTNTPQNTEPPKPPKEFADIFACMLNLKGKKAIDGKNIIRFLATSLSNNCYALYKEVCGHNGNLPASKFGCLRGLSENDAYNCLLVLSKTGLEKTDWQEFTSQCIQKQKKGRKRRKDVSATIEFGNTTQIYINQKPMSGSCLCFKFCTNEQDKEDITLSSLELKDLVFGDNQSHQRGKVAERTSKWATSIGSSHSGSPCASQNVLCSDSEPDTREQRESYDSNIIADSPVFNMSTKTRTIQLVSNYCEQGRSNRTSTDIDQSPCKFIASPAMNSTTIDSVNTKRSLDIEKSLQSSKKFKRILTMQSDVAPSSSKISLFSVKDFLKEIVNENVCKKALDGEELIQESDVETMPEKIQNSECLLQIDLQEVSRPYFEDDAWLVVENTLKQIQEKNMVENSFNTESLKITDKKCGKRQRNVYSFSSDLSPVKEFSIPSPNHGKSYKKLHKKTNPGETTPCKVRLTDISTVQDLQNYTDVKMSKRH